LELVIGAFEKMFEKRLTGLGPSNIYVNPPSSFLSAIIVGANPFEDKPRQERSARLRGRPQPQTRIFHRETTTSGLLNVLLVPKSKGNILIGYRIGIWTNSDLTVELGTTKELGIWAQQVLGASAAQ
jgi:hypothetical protein